MAAEGSVVAVYVNEDIFHRDNEVHADANNSCVKSKQSNLSYQMPKTGSSNKKGDDKWREILFVSQSFLVHILWVKRERETTLSLSCAGETQQRQMYSRY